MQSRLCGVVGGRQSGRSRRCTHTRSSDPHGLFQCRRPPCRCAFTSPRSRAGLCEVITPRNRGSFACCTRIYDASHRTASCDQPVHGPNARRTYSRQTRRANPLTSGCQGARAGPNRIADTPTTWVSSPSVCAIPHTCGTPRCAIGRLAIGTTTHGRPAKRPLLGSQQESRRATRRTVAPYTPCVHDQ